MKTEVLRRLVRRFFGWNSSLYKTGAAFINFVVITNREGLQTYRDLMRLKNGDSKVAQKMRLGFTNLDYPIEMRSADVETVINNVVREEYGQFFDHADPEWMVDAGAYIGDSSAYFLSRFRTLKVVALEPNRSSYEMAQDNLAPYGKRCMLLRKGLWGCNKTLRFGGEFTGASVRDNGFEIEGIDVPTILEQYSIPRIDILKMDIEGAEESVFSTHPAAWIHRVDMLIIEFHGEDRRSMILNVLKENGFSREQYRSLWYCKQAGIASQEGRAKEGVQQIA